MSIEIKISKKPISYKRAMLFLNKRVEEVKNGKKRELLWILEHPITYTAGVRFNKKEILDKKIDIIQTNRGGKITLHNPGQKIVYFVINLNNRKKPLEAIEAFCQYHKNHKSSVLHIVGDGPLKAECENLIQDLNMSEHIYMHGHLTDPYKILSSSEILIHTSLAEGISRSVMESLFLGLIVVGRDIDEHEKLLVENNSVKFFDTKNLVSALNKASEIVRNSNGSLKKNLLPSLYYNEEVSKKILKSLV